VDVDSFLEVKSGDSMAYLFYSIESAWEQIPLGLRTITDQKILFFFGSKGVVVRELRTVMFFVFL